MIPQSVLWKRLDQPGHEAARVSRQDSSWQLHGTAVFAHQQQPCRLDYLVVCTLEWQTVSAWVRGWIGAASIDLALSVDAACHWRLNGQECDRVAGCLDLDLNFSPSTNLLPIRRVDLAIGQEAEVQAAWLRFPEFALAPLAQRYCRLSANSYRYESANGFVTTLQVNPAGFVTHYPDFWQVAASTC